MVIAGDHSYRNMYIRRKLLTEVEKWALETHAEKIRLVSGEERHKAHDFYRHWGYVNNKKQLRFIKIIYSQT